MHHDRARLRPGAGISPRRYRARPVLRRTHDFGMAADNAPMVALYLVRSIWTAANTRWVVDASLCTLAGVLFIWMTVGWAVFSGDAVQPADIAPVNSVVAAAPGQIAE